MTTKECTKKEFTSLKDFYPYYLSQHQHPVCRALHFAGTSFGLVLAFAAIGTANPWLLLAGIIQGYIWAWIGHFVFEKNKPATFTYPLYSFVCDLKMYRDIWLRRL
ncbi:Mpo1-like protein [Spongorhabdus nitratireducens]